MSTIAFVDLKILLVCENQVLASKTNLTLFVLFHLLWDQTRNLLRIAIFNISYIRGLFPDKYFTDKSVAALGKSIFYSLFSFSFFIAWESGADSLWNLEMLTDMKIKKLMPMDAESRRLIDWMEKGFIEPISIVIWS